MPTPITLGEVGNIPTPKLLRKQPRWAWYMYWHDPSQLEPLRKALRKIYESQAMLSHDQLPWVKTKKPKTHYPVLK